MHFEILVEDRSGKALLDLLVPKIIGTDEHTFRVIAYRGIGHLPKGMKLGSYPRQRVLLNTLPRILRGYGRSLANHGVVIVVVDSDRNDCRKLLKDLRDTLAQCKPAPRTLFRIAIEEMEAWLFGDREAILQAYPRVNRQVLNQYRQDSACGTAELLADALRTPGKLTKGEWAVSIGRFMDPQKNASPSFQKFRDGLLRLAR